MHRAGAKGGLAGGTVGCNRALRRDILGGVGSGVGDIGASGGIGDIGGIGAIQGSGDIQHIGDIRDTYG